jgi:hypothetical protein
MIYPTFVVNTNKQYKWLDGVIHAMETLDILLIERMLVVFTLVQQEVYHHQRIVEEDVYV